MEDLGLFYGIIVGEQAVLVAASTDSLYTHQAWFEHGDHRLIVPGVREDRPADTQRQTAG
jgi:hypothetical protein